MTAKRLLLCTDLDRTLLPNGPQRESPRARQGLAALVAHPEVSLAFVSGRDRQRVLAAMAEFQLPAPDFVIGDVGTTIYDLRSGTWQLWQEWRQRIAADWGGKSWRQLHPVLAQDTPLHLQREDQQGEFKLSYFVPANADRLRLAATLDRRLNNLGIATRLVWSTDETAGVGLLDILPRRAGKLQAVEFLGAALGLSWRQCLFAGDSGNDLEVLASPIPAVLVANAIAEVRAEAVAAADRAGNREQLYLAGGNFCGLNGNYSAGILEGVAHFHPELVEFFASALESHD
ncbi:hypothetical protein JCM30471_11540 [Desulfuromonas carbonis]|uniref:HAD-IIB family hydrolase n=1 Tax=Desulfuromonas sp. DDH964 TaxID=1823759 RepID=UPI00078B4A73|nr:HAD-IIB family hydrolase [Desulfuromonas sp. DDH964]AMV72637.1 Mannosylfructose-phosphate phosphatase [Desulfuromonas sp. DDH964]